MSLNTQSNSLKILRPFYLTEADYPWLERLIDEAGRFVGRRRHDLARRFTEPMPFDAPRYKLQSAIRQLTRMIGSRPVGHPTPAALRSVLFRSGAEVRASSGDDSLALGSPGYRSVALAAAAASLGGGSLDVPEMILARLYGDVLNERIIDHFPEDLSPASLAITANGFIVASHLKRAHLAVIDLFGETRRVIRQAKLRGLLCTAIRTRDAIRLEVSGPLAVIHQTKYYGRALAELVPFLAWCPRYEILATCAGTKEPYRVLVRSGDPIPPAPARPAYDSQVERYFAGDFGRATDDWDLVREPEPVEAPTSGGGLRLVFPDFAAVRRNNRSDRWLIEIIGFWTPRYLASKLEGLQGVTARLMLCIDERLAYESGALPQGATVVRFKRRVDVRAVLAIIDA